MDTLVRVWILLLVYPFITDDVTALRCFECTDVFKPYFCDFTTQCTTGEECFVDQYVTSSGTVLFTSGCRSTQRCDAGKRDLTSDVEPTSVVGVEDQSSDITVCSECCNNTDFCNLQGCGEAAIPRSSRGPLCFDCLKQGRHGCRHVTQCDVHYSCDVTTEVLNGITVYNSQCVHSLSSAHCNTTNQRSMPSLIGKRDQNTADFCPKCCDDDFCNEDCLERPVVVGAWSQWSPWGSCSVTCGAGSYSRTRTCSNPFPSDGAHGCVGDAQQTVPCNTTAPCPVNGGYSDWSPWGQCDVTCGTTGTQLRTRLCNNPVPEFGGAGCKGDSADVRQCVNLPACSFPNGGLSDWEPWSACPYTCGGSGQQYRHRKCLHPPCVGPFSDSKSCSYQSHCPVDGGYTDWTHWSACSNTCGKQGQHTRSRSCTKPAPAYGGHGCLGPHTETKACVTGSAASSCLPVPSVTEVWSEWSECSRSCGHTGSRRRHKQCFDTLHHLNMSLCTQPIHQQDPCNLGDCPVVNGGWTSWSRWAHCTSQCGQGYQNRHRSCSHPRPSGGGQSCHGENHERQPCDNTGLCNDSGYSTWSDWSACSQSCGSTGLKTRTRTCKHGRPNHGDCQGSDTEHVSCNDHLTCQAKVDGGWGPWDEWSACSASCGSGQHHRRRLCNQPTPQNGGHHCVGSATDKSTCTANCPESACESVTGYHLYDYRTHIASSTRVKAYLCLQYSTDQHSWSRASRICHAAGGSLAAFDTWEEDYEAFTHQLHGAYPRVPDLKLWIGLSYHRGRWAWEDGRHIGYFAQHKLGTNFTAVPAAFSNGACVLDDGNHWILAGCDESHYYMCERNVE